MVNKILRTSSFLLLSLFITTSILISGVITIEATQITNENNLDNKSNIVIKDSSNTISNERFTNTPDLGDEQAFPFIPGFGKNSGKD